MKRSPLKRGKPMARTRMKKKPAPHGFPDEVKTAARHRAGGLCEVGSEACTGKPEHFHHRKLRGHKDHSISNCLFVCSGCHTRIHANPEMSYLAGWMVRSFDDPVLVPVKCGNRYRDRRKIAGATP